MKTALYVNDGCTQVVLTPETPVDKLVIEQVLQAAKSAALSCYRGEFYECRGGWYREGQTELSLVIRVNPPTPCET